MYDLLLRRTLRLRGPLQLELDLRHECHAGSLLVPLARCGLTLPHRADIVTMTTEAEQLSEPERLLLIDVSPPS
jgi:hypothetical protein